MTSYSVRQGADSEIGAFGHGIRRNEVPVDQREHAQFAGAHSATRCRPLCR